jgi:hypothetical protein
MRGLLFCRLSRPVEVKEETCFYASTRKEQGRNLLLHLQLVEPAYDSSEERRRYVSGAFPSFLSFRPDRR